jgi:ABC-type branched-subunit amino acid transport system ATPase component
MLDVRGVGIAFGGIRALEDVSFRTEPGRILSIIGQNGAGKTKLFNLVSGLYRLRSGQVMLDEPAAGCNPSETAELEDIILGIARSGVSVVLVEHDIGLVMNLSHRIVVLNHGRVLAEGRPAEIQSNASVIEAYLGAGTATEEADAVSA